MTHDDPAVTIMRLVQCLVVIPRNNALLKTDEEEYDYHWLTGMVPVGYGRQAGRYRLTDSFFTTSSQFIRRFTINIS
jgi:hypothetical protein